MPRQKMEPETKRRLAAIDPAKLYPLPVLQEASGLGTASFRQLRRHGLAVRYAHGRAFVLGRDFIQAVAEGKEQKDD